MKVVVLAAGEGSRLRPYTENKPKVMLPVLNRPILGYALEALVQCGFEEATVVVGYCQQRVRDHFADGENWGISLSYVEQRQQFLVRPYLQQGVFGSITDSCQGPQEDRDRHRALAIELQGEIITLAGFKFHPGAAVWDQLRNRQRPASRPIY